MTRPSSNHKHSWTVYGLFLNVSPVILVRCECGSAGNIKVGSLGDRCEPLRLYFNGPQYEIPLREDLVAEVQDVVDACYERRT